MTEADVPIAGRGRAADAIVRAIKRRSPAPVLRALRGAAAPVRRVVWSLARRRRIARVLAPALRDEFRRLHEDARARWWRGERGATGDPILLPLAGGAGGVWVRPGTSDVLLYSDVIIDEQYGRAVPTDVRTIVDCGANVGLTAAYFLTRFPRARLIAVEPDPVNFALCSRNLEPFGDRALVLHAALSAQPQRMRVADPSTAGTWASTVAPATDDDGGDAVEGLDVSTLLARFGADVVDILKIDIEGAEAEVLSAADVSWLDRVRCLQIELENEASKVAFYRAVAGRPFVLAQSGDAIVALRREAAG